MKTSTIVAGLVVIVIIAGGAWYWFSTTNNTAAPVTPNGTAGINGSDNQGNLGQPSNGQVQQPGADGAEGSVIGANLALGTSSNGQVGSYLVGYNGMTLYTYI